MENAISPAYRKDLFAGEWFPDGAAPLPGYTDGSLSGGWETPVFTKDVLLTAIEAGLVGDPAYGTSKCFFDDARDAFIMVSAIDGDRLPEGMDIVALAAAGDDEVSVGGRDIRIEVGVGFDIEVGGQSVHVYQLGSGLIWSLAD